MSTWANLYSHKMTEQEALLSQEEPKNWAEQHFGLGWGKVITIAIIVITIGIYIGNLLFGNNSLEALLQLQEYESTLTSEVKKLKEENALMQKEYFELKEITAKK